MHALLVIDVQQALITGAYREAQTLDAICQSIDVMRSNQQPIVFIQHCHQNYQPMFKGEPGWQLHDRLVATEKDIFINKQASDAFYQTDLMAMLEAADVTHVVVCGLQSEFCVDATCRSALSHGFDVTLVSDGHTTGDSALKAADIIKHHNFTLQNLAHPDHKIELCESTSLHIRLNSLE